MAKNITFRDKIAAASLQTPRFVIFYPHEIKSERRVRYMDNDDVERLSADELRMLARGLISRLPDDQVRRLLDEVLRDRK